MTDIQELTEKTKSPVEGHYGIFVFAFGTRLHYEISDKPSEEEISILVKKIEQRFRYDVGNLKK